MQLYSSVERTVQCSAPASAVLSSQAPRVEAPGPVELWQPQEQTFGQAVEGELTSGLISLISKTKLPAPDNPIPGVFIQSQCNGGHCAGGNVKGVKVGSDL